MERASMQSSHSRLSRRDALGASVALAGGALLLRADETGPSEKAVNNGRLKQSVCKWCYKMPLDDLCRAASEMGLAGIDLIKPEEFATLKKYGLIGTMTTTHGIVKGLNDPANHDMCLELIKRGIEATAAEGWRNVICFSGNRNGMDDETGMKNCVTALHKVLPLAEKSNVVINMELLNSRVDHADYMCDTSKWGIELVKRVGSDHFKLLYDIYHMQIMEGDVIRSIQNNHQYFGHYHTAGNPGRHELDETQELYYPAICRAIVATGFDGFMAQEFVPTRDQLVSLKEAVKLCDV
jgi:hydroxypyruvate isomerase